MSSVYYKQHLKIFFKLVVLEEHLNAKPAYNML